MSDEEVAYCWICETLLTDDNRSREHIIPEALGGRRTINNFLCRRCNNTTGSKWDADLIESVKPMDFIASSRDWHEADPPLSYNLGNRANRHDSVSGTETRTMYRGGGDSVVSMDGRELQVEIASNSEVQLTKIVRAILRKYAIPREEWADIEQKASSQLPKASPDSHFIHPGVSLNLPAASRSMVKSMLALACDEGVKREECQGILGHWRKDVPRYLGDSPDWEVLPLEERIDNRCVAISGSAETGILFGFVDFTGSLPWIMPLIVPYKGPYRHATYAIDGKTGKDVNVSPKMERPRAEEVSMELVARLAEMVSTVEDLSPEESASMARLGHMPSEAEERSIKELFAPGIRGIYNLSRESFNQKYRLPLGLPPVGEDGHPC